MEYVTLNNGIKMPMAGIGVFMMSPQRHKVRLKMLSKAVFG